MKFILALSIIYLIFIHKSFNLSLKLIEKKDILTYKIDNQFKLSEGPIYSRGWVKFSNFEKNSPVKPNIFIKNSAFKDQFKGNTIINLKAEDDIGLINIPEDDYHFAILTEKALNLVSSRNNELAKTIEVINLDEIIPIASKTEFQGGLTNHGDFLEGYCFQIHTITKQNKNFVWEICANTKNTKINFMNSIVNLLFKRSDRNGDNLYKLNENEINRIDSLTKNLKKGISKETLEKIKKAKEPTWIAITPWSDCSKTCGGGKSYLQRICIVPKTSKKHCSGERIIRKDCNLSPCEVTNKNYSNFNNTENSKNSTILYSNRNSIKEISISKSPINKIPPLSKKLLRYERCIIKEGDLALFINDGYLKGTKIPVRVILNNRTLTVYSSDTYESIIISHRLSAISGLREYSKEKTNSCFELEEKTKKTVLCAFISNNENLQILAAEWQKDILDFIKNCLEYHSQEEINRVNSENIKNTLDFYSARESEETEKIILRTQHLALQALEKELKVENLIEKEEEEREKLLAEEYEKKLEKIKNQKEIINQALEQKKKQADIYSNKQVVKKKIIQISEAVKRQVEKIREDLKSRLLAKKKDEARKRELIRNKIESLKKDISKDLIRASKKGDFDECNPERDGKQIINYCKVNYQNDDIKIGDCIKNDNFCYMCCESEYGDLHLELRNNCYNKCNDFYFFKAKFKHTKILNTYNEIKPNMIKITNSEEVNLKKSEGEIDHNNENSKSSNDIDIMKTKFLENKNTFISKNENLKIDEVDYSSQNKVNQNKIYEMIEIQKKKELLMKIKEDLNFD